VDRGGADLIVLGGPTHARLDDAFLTDMIRHHMVAVMMSHQLLMRPIAVHSPVRRLATEISREQSDEIHQMRQWLLLWFGRAGDDGRHMPPLTG
jgi:uncharacterized protein (DUF305 family)